MRNPRFLDELRRTITDFPAPVLFPCRRGLRSASAARPAPSTGSHPRLTVPAGRPGPARPVTGSEDVAALPEHVRADVAGLESIMRPLGLEACYYGHAATGLLHVRPVIDLHSAADIAKLRQVTNEVSALVRQFKGSFAAEHGVGIARTEYMPEQVGEELLGVMREIKRVFDPKNLFNPGKIISDGRFRLDRDLRWGAGYKIELPFEPVLAFAAKDHSFVGNLEQCNGCGGCRKDAPTMCPTFLATGEEYMSTRGRANAIRAALDLRMTGDDPLRSEELEDALSTCLSCKACTTEGPSNVNLALPNAALIQARSKRHGPPPRCPCRGCACSPSPGSGPGRRPRTRWLVSVPSW